MIAESSASPSSVDSLLVGLRSSSKYSFHVQQYPQLGQVTTLTVDSVHLPTIKRNIISRIFTFGARPGVEGLQGLRPCLAGSHGDPAGFSLKLRLGSPFQYARTLRKINVGPLQSGSGHDIWSWNLFYNDNKGILYSISPLTVIFKVQGSFQWQQVI